MKTTQNLTNFHSATLSARKNNLIFFGTDNIVVRLIAVFILFALAQNLSAQGVITQTTTVDFSKGYLNNVAVGADNVVLPYQSNGYSVNWTATTSLPNKRYNHKLSYWNNKVYLTGGMEYKGMSLGHEVTDYSRSVYSADVTTGIGAWSAMDSLPVGISDHAALVINGYLYVIGGKSGGSPTNTIYYTKILSNGVLQGWQTTTAVLPQPLWGLTAEYVNGYLVIAGGSSQASKYTASGMVYTSLVNPDGDITSFTTQPSLPQVRNQHTMCAYGSTLYVMGGYDNTGVVQSSVYYTTVGLDGNCSSWQTAGGFPQAVYGHTSTCVNGILTVMGGYTDTTGNAIAQSYHAKIDNAPAFSWQTNNYYPIHVAFADAFAVNGKIFNMGGIDVFENTHQESYYNSLVMSGTDKVKTGTYLSPLINLASNTLINQLGYTAIGLTDYQVWYRYAESGGVWSSWMTTALANPATVSVNKQYFQYMFAFDNALITNTVTINDVSTYFNASTFSGTLSGSLHWTLAGSPYICTADAVLESGTLTIDPGVVVLFMNETGLEVRSASLNCNGTSSMPVRFSSFSNEPGWWDGLFFNDASNAYSSVFNYTIIEMAGFGSRIANLYCENTNQPALVHCTLRYSTGYGARYATGSPTITSTAFNDNTGIGFAIQGNSFPQMQNLSFSNNLANGIVVLGGNITVSGTWKNVGSPYVIWGDVSIFSSPAARLTIAAGNTVKGMPGKRIYIGYDNLGELYAVGKPDSVITFTSYNGLNGGWEGLNFNSSSGNPRSSVLKNCIVEKGNLCNLKSEYSDQPLIDSCVFRKAAGDGVQINGNTPIYHSVFENNGGDGIEILNGSPVFDHIIVRNNGGNGIYLSCNNGSTTGIVNSTVQNNAGHGFCMSPRNTPEFYNVSFTGNQTNNEIVVLNGNINYSTLWKNEGMAYVLWGDVNIYSNPAARLTIAAGNTIKGMPGKGIIIGQDNLGELYAAGKSDSVITFTSYNGLNGGWAGLYYSSSSGSPRSSVLKHCIVEKGNQYNLMSFYSDQPLVDSCVFRNSAGDGIRIDGSAQVYHSVFENNAGDGIEILSGSPALDHVTVRNNSGNGIYLSGNDGSALGIVNSIIQNNAGHGFCMSPRNTPDFFNVSFSGNLTNNEIIVIGGNINYSTLWKNEGMAYVLWGDVNIYSNPAPRLTIAAGNTIKGMPGKGFIIGQDNLGELYAVGKPDSLITFTSYNGLNGGWAGLSYSSSSGSPRSSVLKHCIVEKGNQYNLMSFYSDQPLIDSCIIRNSAGDGIRINYCNLSVSHSVIENNAGNGINLTSNNGSSPKIISSTIQNNILHGFCMYPQNSPDILNTAIYGNHLSNEIAVLAGDINYSTKWKYAGCGYDIYGDVSIFSNPAVRLTIAAGNTIKGFTGKGIRIGENNLGELYAVGKPDSLITFTSYNGLNGGWAGLYFSSSSGSPSSSVLKHCIVEKGNLYNLKSEYSDQPLIDSCFIRNSAGDGIQIYRSDLSVSHTVIENNAGNGINLTSNYTSSPKIIGSTVQNNTLHGFCMYPCNSPVIQNVTVSGNHLSNEIAVLAGDMNYSTRWNYAGCGYDIYGDVSIFNSPAVRLTIAAGNTIKGMPGKGIIIGRDYFGELYAVGKPDSLITFTSFNGLNGGWSGLYFSSSSGSPSSSVLKHCIVEKGNLYNLKSEYSDQPFIDSCIIRNSAGDGIQINYSNLSVSHSIIENNAGNGINLTSNNRSSPKIIGSTIQNNTLHGFCMNPCNSPVIQNMTVSGNHLSNEIAVLAGPVNYSTKWMYAGCGYGIWGDVSIYNSSAVRLTIAAGNTIKGMPGMGIFIGRDNLGELYAVGKPDSLITFTSHNGLNGGWGGLNYNSGSGSPRSSILKHCVVEKGNLYNLKCEYSDQPSIDSCVFRLSANEGLDLQYSSLQLKRSQVIFNYGNGIYITGSSNPIIGNSLANKCDIYGNGTYEVYNNSANDIPAAYNFWNSQDTSFIASRIYDKYDNPDKGIVFPANPAASGLQLSNETNLWGRLTYDNSVFTGMKYSTIKISNLAGDSLNSAATNLGGYYLNIGTQNGGYVTSARTTNSLAGVNATDALMIMRHYALIQSLTGLRKKAADVNASGGINSTDAMLVLQRYSHLISSFAAGDWYFEKDTVTIAGSPVESNLKGICFGDVNGSNIPTGSKSATGNELSLIWEGSVQAGSYQQMVLPLKVKSSLQTGAISLGFYYPEEFMKIEGVTLGNGNTNVVYSSENGMLLIAWSQLDPFILNQDEILLNLIISTKDLSGLTAPIALQLAQDVELADGAAHPLPNITLSIPLIESMLTGTHEGTALNPEVNIYPNPVVSDAIVSMILPGQGSYDIRVYDVVGKVQESVSNEYNNSGKCMVRLGCGKYTPGIYLAKIRISCAGQEFNFSKKIVVQH